MVHQKLVLGCIANYSLPFVLALLVGNVLCHATLYMTSMHVTNAAVLLQITTAAITTTHEGNVYDVFQVKLDEDHASWTAQDVQCQVHSNLYSNFISGAGDKRRRMIGV